MKAVEDERPPTPSHPLRGHTGGDHPPTPRRGTPNLRVTLPVGLRTHVQYTNSKKERGEKMKRIMEKITKVREENKNIVKSFRLTETSEKCLKSLKEQTGKSENSLINEILELLYEEMEVINERAKV